LIELRQTIESFLLACRQPALSEPGEETLALSAANFALETRGSALSLQAWDDRRNLVRRVTGIERQTRGKLVLKIERFAKRPGTLALIDLAQPSGQDVALHTRRLEFRDRFRLFLRRQFPGFQLAALTTEPDLEHSLSPAYPRALLRRGASAWAAIGASPDLFHAEGVLTFGLIWLDYLRRREPSLTIQGLILYLPAGLEKTTCLRLLFLDPAAAQYAAFAYGEDGEESRIDLADYGNLDTRLDPCARATHPWLNSMLDSISEIPGVESVARSGGERSLRVHGMEFARTSGGELLFGLDRKRVAHPRNAAELQGLASSLSRFRSSGATDRLNPLYLRNPEAWLESQVRNTIEQIDARFLAAPIYGQVPAFAAADRGVLDLLAVERGGRLAVLELKASEDLHLPLQALDYWMRVKWHLGQGEFGPKGYFPGIELCNEAPRLLLVSPALDFHPSNETVLRYFSPAVPVERVGVGLEWRKELKIMSRS
jgi:hypothetical protein